MNLIIIIERIKGFFDYVNHILQYQALLTARPFKYVNVIANNYIYYLQFLNAAKGIITLSELDQGKDKQEAEELFDMALSRIPKLEPKK